MRWIPPILARPHWPVRVRAGAFAEAQPRRDLLLSPDHAVFVDDVLIPIKYLTNGLSIFQQAVDRVEYFHIEVAGHDVLLAEGLAVESYLDTGQRWSFESTAEPLALFANFAARTWEALACAPLLVRGPKVDAVRRRLADRVRRGCDRDTLSATAAGGRRR